MTTIEDTIASHLDTNWNAAAGANPEPTIGIRLEVFDVDNLTVDNIYVDSRTLLSRTRTGAGILKEEWVVTLQVGARVVNATDTKLKDRLESIVNEILHVMDRYNHPIASYHDHYARQVPYLSQPNSDELTYATVEVYLKKEASTA